MSRNQYSDVIPVEWYIEYKKEETSEERREEIKEDVFRLIREINLFPENEVDLEDEVRHLRALARIDIGKFYDGNIIKPNNVGQALCYKYYPNIWDIKKNRVGIRPLSMRDAFFSDKDLRRAIGANLTYDGGVEGLRSWFRMSDVGYGMNFRPSSAKIIYETNLENNSRVLDYSAGYGGRMLGAWSAERVEEYVGIEPNSETYENAIRFSRFLNEKHGDQLKVRMIKRGSEEITLKEFPEYKHYFDIAFSSPPYFDMEQYSNEETQAYIKFPEYKGWVKGYLRPTIHNCIDMLKPEGIFAVNIFEDETYGKARGIKKILEFVCGEKGFRLYKIDYMEVNIRAGNGERDRKERKKEPVFYFKR